ncbi:MAG TPA: exodeoxyribonuclease V subunit gamma [Rhodanobacteraceae bacterium]|nr:exodeoxyribonuclease V subunit gamma [Rhodanobacteraceae bacterium]
MIIYRASRLEALLDPLQTLMQAAPPQHLLAPHSVIAAHPGMQRWLSRELALRRGPRGIVANLRIELPSEWLDRLVLAALGGEAVALRPYRRDILRWRIHECLGELGDSRVAAYLGDSGGSRAQRRFQLAERLARIYTRYLVYRPDWLREWASGRDPTRSGTFLAPLWKMLHRQIALPHRGEMIARLLAALEKPAADVLGAEPLHVFGLAHLAPAELDVLRAVARHRPVVLYVPDPCREFWGGLRTDRQRLRELLREDPDAAATQVAFLGQDHPLLASWGRMGQQFMLALDDSGAAIDERHWQDQSDTPQLDTRLHRLQESIRQLKPELIGAPTDFETARADRSLHVHACHTRLRELEVLRDTLLRARSDDPQLKPSGIVVMMPDIQAYLPLLPAVFGEAGRHEGPLPYHCFDVAVARAHPLFSAFRQLLDLAQARVTAPEVVDLLAVPQVARKLGLGAGDVDVLTRWLQDSRVAWALDAGFRARFGVPAIAEHTFAWAMDRMIAGYAVGSPEGEETAALALPDLHIAPLDGVHGPQAALVGALDALLIEVEAWTGAGALPRPASAWAAWLEQRLDALFSIDPTDREAREAKAFLLRFARAIADEPGESGLDPVLDFSVVREALLDRLDAVPEQQRFLLGGVTFCGMVPQRSIPFDVVAVLGLNDGEFPRGGSDAGLDLMATQRRFGDRDTRSDDRYLFLETVMSARTQLHLSYIGEGVRDGKPRNPAAPLAELMEALDAAVAETATADTRRATAKPRAADVEVDEKEREKRRRPWLVRHPLQPFDARYFDRGDAALFSFNADFAAMRSDPLRGGPGPFVVIDSSPSAAQPAAATIELKDVVAYFKDPAKQLLKNALNLRLDAVDESRLRHSEPLEAHVDAIDQVAKRLFNEAVARADQRLPDTPPDWLRLTGVLPPGRAGSEAWAEELAKARQLVAAVAHHELFAGGLPRARPQWLEHAIDLGDAAPVVRGELRRIHQRDGALWIMDCYPGRNAKRSLDFKQRIAFFLEWALLRLHAPAKIPVRASVVIDDGYDDGWQRSFETWNARFEEPRTDRRESLEDVERRVAGLLDFWRRAQHEPQWYFPATSWALVTHGPEKAREQWAGSARSKRAERDYAPGYARLLARDRDFDAGVDLAALHANALHLRSLIDLERPLGDAA